MRLPVRHFAALAALFLVGCGTPDGEVDRAVSDLREARDADLNEIMLTVADPVESVAYFQRLATETPDAIEIQRGLATSLVRAKRGPEGVAAWRRVTAHPQSGPADGVELADALIRTNDWDGAEKVLDGVPPTFETFQRYRLEAMVADSNQEWARADSFYETAVGLTTTPAGALNNWGYSKLTRGDYRGAERLFTDALRQEPGLFTAKNNLVLARGAQRNYQLPVIPLSQTERAQLLYTLALTAIKQSDVTIGRGLLREAVDTHPQHFEEAARALRALEGGATN
ncbi:tetratricopeptide repeat protein [Limimaricola cinnabarinus]|jgi:Flp pilus assembly protein TadD|uniref:Flp pilus assembly protein TadD, contains TPR repeat n=1 Tax=Limimaricola cinnabarinus LL-001 TaxID=1337093 RepID=U2Z0G8_9RHOB|nr:tetratricopeptide repeat protein [Limimaricola cinnabarinus]GAD54587.1 flp pilus assembly protein TadD, contains TPR repeat [Limimaricola cinnabarinus LL-001]